MSNNKGKFTSIGYITETQKSKEGKSEKTFMLKIAPMDKALSGVQLNRGAKILLRAPKQGKNQSEEDFAKLKEWKLFDCTLITEDEPQDNNE
jgi:hypothetical protein